MEGGSKSGNSLIRGRCGRLDRWPALVPSRRPWSGPTAARSRAAGLVRRRFRGRWLPKVNGTRPAASGITQLTPSPRSTRLPLPDLVRTQPPARRLLRSPRRALKGFARIDPPTLGIAGWSSAGTAFQLGDRTMLLSPDHLPTRGVARWSSARTTSNSKRRSPLLNPDHPPTRGGAPWSSARTIDQLGGSHPAPQPGPPANSESRGVSLRGRHHPFEHETIDRAPSSRQDRARAPVFFDAAHLAGRPSFAPARGRRATLPRPSGPTLTAPPPLPRTSPRSPPLRSTVNHPTEPRGAQFFS